MKELSALFRIISFLAYSGMWCCEPVEEVRQFILTTRTVAFSILARLRSEILPATSYFF